MRRALLAALTTLYGTGAVLVFCLLLALATVLAVLVPGLDRRRRVTHRLAHVGLTVLGLRLRVIGLERLPAGSCVVVANHSSYLDGVVMKAVLPPRFCFVIKQEAASLPLAGYLLKRIGSEFVEREDPGGRRRGALRVLRIAETGRALVFFPEGTFDGTPGLKRFHIGAFAAAARGNMPVVPVVIRGARRAMPNGALIVRPGRIEIEVLEPVAVDESRPSAEDLRACARRQIVGRLDEPDLAPLQTNAPPGAA